MPIVLIISLSSKSYEEVCQKYYKAGGKFKTFHVQGVRASQKDRDNFCTPTCRLMCSDSLVGCAIAHDNALKLATEHDATFVYEDDVEFGNNFDEEMAMDYLKKYDLVALGNMVSSKSKINMFDHLAHFIQVGSLIDTKQKNQYKVKWLYGMHGYLVSSKSANKIRSFIPFISTHIDIEMSKLLKTNKITGIGLRPPMVVQAHFSKSSQSNNKSLDVADSPSIDYQLNFNSWKIHKTQFSSLNMILFWLLLFICFPLGVLYFMVIYFTKKQKDVKN